MTRPTLDETMISIAGVLADRGTCCKRKVGCVVTDRKGNILSTGYNGQPKGQPHCTPMLPCPAFTNPVLSCNAIHAEMNALIRCSDIDKVYSVYITAAPCEKCRLLISNTEAKRMVYVIGEDIIEEKLP